jgi:hypothetical protein
MATAKKQQARLAPAVAEGDQILAENFYLLG